uniref:Uncharacterized protein n=1 Tax=Eutreptiella gymnastica TaxID=73025 RepID=A0A7S4LML6_9EUGL
MAGPLPTFGACQASWSAAGRFLRRVALCDAAVKGLWEGIVRMNENVRTTTQPEALVCRGHGRGYGALWSNANKIRQQSDGCRVLQRMSNDTHIVSVAWK